MSLKNAVCILIFCPWLAWADQSTSLFEQPLRLQGTLGDAMIEMHLHAKPDPNEGIQGEYLIAGKQVLLAGEVNHTEIVLEESVNGKDISGEWVGNLQNGIFRGTWSDNADKVHQEFVLNLDPTNQKTP